MLNKFLLWSGLVVPWLTLFWMKRESVKRYMPVAIFVSLLVTILYEIGYTYKWWVIKDMIVPWGYINNVSFIYGPFLVGTIWIFYYTFPNFGLYMITNAIVDAVFAFGLLRLTNLLGIDEFINLTYYGAFFIMLALAFVIYFYQRWQEEIFKESTRNEKRKIDPKITWSEWMGIKRKAR